MNEIVYQDEKTTTLKLSRGKTVSLDTADYARVREFHWYANRSRNGCVFYAAAHVRRNNKRTSILMHCLLMPEGDFTDHRDGDGLNNRRSNLRRASRSENGMNQRKRGRTSRYHGVHFQSSMGKWVAKIIKDRKFVYLGSYVDEESAARARKVAEEKYYPGFTRERDGVWVPLAFDVEVTRG